MFEGNEILNRKHNVILSMEEGIALPIKIFVAHPSEDEDTERVLEILNKMSPPLVINMFPSTKHELYFPDAIRRTIEETNILLAILNKNGRKNQWVNQEVGIAVANDIDIVILAEKREKLRGFVNKRNKDILLIQTDDLEEELRSWLEDYQEKNKLKVLERMLKGYLNDIWRIYDEENFESQLDPERKKYMSELGKIRGNIWNILNNYRHRGPYMRLDYLANVRVGVDKFSTEVKLKRFEKFVKETDFYPIVDEYFKARGFEGKIPWVNIKEPKARFHVG